MNTISFDEPINISKNHFKTLEDFQLYIIEKLQKEDLSDAHKTILDKRLLESKKHPNNFLTLETLKSSITRR